MTVRGHRTTDSRAERILAMLARYQPVPGVYDEMLDAQGEPREHWKPILATLADLGPRELERRFAGADRYMRESGVFTGSMTTRRTASGPGRWPICRWSSRRMSGRR